MINLTKLIGAKATISEIIKKDAANKISSLHFSRAQGPVVVWNMTAVCNLSCKHCYLGSQDNKQVKEFTTKEAKSFISDLPSMNVPVLLFTGGEPLLRQDIFELGEFAANSGLRPVISTNGTLITLERARTIKDAGFQYVGVSIDGMEDVHNEFRRLKNSFALAWEGIHNCLSAGLPTGVRFTVNNHNLADLPAVLDLAIKEAIPRFCLYHLVYAGRGKEMVKDDLRREENLQLINFLIDKAARTTNMEILTVDNPADGVYLYLQKEKESPQEAAEIKSLLEMAGGCSAGEKVVNVSPEGNIYPCQFWRDLPLGNVRTTPLSQIWQEKIDFFKQLKANLKGKCGRCSYKELCGGCRVRAKVIYGDYLAEDPACYIEEEKLRDGSL
ncbi:MAG: radical SAM protein [bacterium]|nr:radical SAM protein [bacterium]